MIWLNPAAALALAVLAVPILIHLLVQRQAPRVSFPTLKFIRPARFAAVRRRAFDDLLLLAVRAAIVAAAVAAAAGPFLATAARRREWNARTVRAEIGDRGRGSLAEQLRRAVASLDREPPGKREIVVRSALPIGSLDDGDIAAVPAHIGLRFERSAAPPASRTMAAAPVIASEAGGSALLTVVEREVTLDRDRTSVRDVRSVPAAEGVPVELLVADDQRPAADALLGSLLAKRLPAPAPGRRARIVFSSDQPDGARADLARLPWMADAAARIGGAASDWIARGGADPVVRFPSGDRLVVATKAAVSDPFAPVLVRLVLESLVAPPDASAEVFTIADERIRAWTRAPGDAVAPRAGLVDRDDRRWLWALVLVLIAVETRLRRSQTADRAVDVEVSRVA